MSDLLGGDSFKVYERIRIKKFYKNYANIENSRSEGSEGEDFANSFGLIRPDVTSSSGKMDLFRLLPYSSGKLPAPWPSLCCLNSRRL